MAAARRYWNGARDELRVAVERRCGRELPATGAGGDYGARRQRRQRQSCGSRTAALAELRVALAACPGGQGPVPSPQPITTTELRRRMGSRGIALLKQHFAGIADLRAALAAAPAAAARGEGTGQDGAVGKAGWTEEGGDEGEREA